jgi:hypothetical protein
MSEIIFVVEEAAEGGYTARALASPLAKNDPLLLSRSSPY